MGDTDTDMIHRHHSSIPKQKHQQQQELNPNNLIRSSASQFSSESGISKRVGVPPTSPYSQIQILNPGPTTTTSHSRSMSQPCSFFSLDSLPPLSPSPFLDDRLTNNPSSLLPPFTSSSRADSLPPRKSHRRSNSDIPTGLTSNPFVKKEDMDDLFSAYMNLDNIDALNSSENLSRDDMESSRASGTKTNSDTEGETSSVNGDHNNNNLKRRAGGGDIAPSSRHYRSVSVDSCFIDKLSFPDDSLKPPPSPGTTRKVSPTNSVDAAPAFSIEFNNGEFTAAEMKKIMANDKLADMAISDPKRVKRILANRQSAARSKERKMRYIVELEHKVQTLQTEATTLSAQLTLLQRDMMGLTNQNNELKFRLQSMEQQARLRDALNEALNGEVQRLKLAIGESSHSNEADRSKMQSLNAEMFQQLNISQLRQQQPQSQSLQNGTVSTKPESNE
ncbi:transcription factor VIP1 [Brassica rapa]|uniref:transcription factor VIP1 n=1 Tax=Brassica campestris TaxID=3711 RepID=UPI00142D2B51|nr:transcription factor VIP1 [Brassica rapa]XP_033129575.1 transcription factor VIP1 [Brassica rapa]XP_033129576.1 transcription factor VIP1 [Brassica rapa]